MSRGEMEEDEESPFKRIKFNENPEEIQFEFERLLDVNRDAAAMVLFHASPLAVDRLCKTSRRMQEFCATYKGIGIWQAMWNHYFGGISSGLRMHLLHYMKSIKETPETYALNYKWLIMAAYQFNAIQPIDGTMYGTAIWAAFTSRGAEEGQHVIQLLVTNLPHEDFWELQLAFPGGIAEEIEDLAGYGPFAQMGGAFVAWANLLYPYRIRVDPNREYTVRLSKSKQLQQWRKRPFAQMIIKLIYLALDQGFWLYQEGNVPLRSACVACQVESPQHVCGDCGTLYCSRECQARDWPQHQELCGKKLTAKKAKEILRHGSVRGHELTSKQRRYFGWVAGGRK